MFIDIFSERLDITRRCPSFNRCVVGKAHLTVLLYDFILLTEACRKAMIIA